MTPPYALSALALPPPCFLRTDDADSQRTLTPEPYGKQAWFAGRAVRWRWALDEAVLVWTSPMCRLRWALDEAVLVWTSPLCPPLPWTTGLQGHLLRDNRQGQSDQSQPLQHQFQPLQSPYQSQPLVQLW